MQRVAMPLLLLLVLAGSLGAQQPLRVGVAGSEPFVIGETEGSPSGIAVDIWNQIAAGSETRFEWQPYESVPVALDALTAGDVDVVVGPVSITAERARHARFSLPFFRSSLSLLSRVAAPSLGERLAPLFSPTFFNAVAVLLLILALVGMFVWVFERRAKDPAFSEHPLRGIGQGIWFAIVTMSTVGYGDIAPRTFGGRLVTGIWIIVSFVAATSLIAGVASTLTLTGLTTTQITSIDQIRGRRVAVLADSPGDLLASSNGAIVVGVNTLEEGRDLVASGGADAFLFDRPQLLYSLRNSPTTELAVSGSTYSPQEYGFAFPLDSDRVHEFNIELLELQESGAAGRIIQSYLGNATE